MQIMGILNVTPDSFSDGGDYLEVEKAVVQAQKMLALGASIIDIGGETTRPGAIPVSSAVEIDRVVPVIQALAKLNCEISIDTYKASVAKAAIEAGATMINDVSGGLFDPEMAKLAAKTGVPIILMHNRFEVGETPHAKRDVEPVANIVSDVIERLSASIRVCLEAGVKREQIIVDPGIGFAKTASESEQVMQNLALIRETLGYPVLLGSSRKRFLTPYLGEENQQQRDTATAVTSILAQQAGCDYVRVHDVASTQTALGTWKMLSKRGE